MLISRCRSTRTSIFIFQLDTKKNSCRRQNFTEAIFHSSRIEIFEFLSPKKIFLMPKKHTSSNYPQKLNKKKLTRVRFSGGIPPRFSIAAAAAGMAQYLSQSQNGQLKAHSGQLVDRSHLYWPGLQGLVTNPMAWRDRLTSSSK